MQLIPPYWFSMRQGKAEPAGDHAYRLTAPNLPESHISVRPAGDGLWVAVLRSSADGPDLAVSEKPYDNLPDAWYAAFELYRTHVVI